MTVTLTLDPVCISQGTLKFCGPKKCIRLRRFQQDVVSFFLSNKKVALLTAPTGSGKTLTVYAPLIAQVAYPLLKEQAHRRLDVSVVTAVYPTKPLVHDQFISVTSMLRELGFSRRFIREGVVEVYEGKVCVQSSDDSSCKSFRIGVAKLTSEALDELVQHTMDNASVPRRLLLKSIIEDIIVRDNVDYLVVSSVPEYPYLLMSRLYSNPDAKTLLQTAGLGNRVYQLARKLLGMNADDRVRVRRELSKIISSRVLERELANIAAVFAGEAVFMDEFHVWNGFEKPTALALILAYLVVEPYTGIDYRIVLSSATPDETLRSILESLLGSDKVKMIKANKVPCNDRVAVKIRGTTTVLLHPVETKSAGPVSWLELDSFLPQLVEEHVDWLKTANRFVVFGRRVSSVEEAAERFHELTGKQPVVVTGVKHPRFPGKEALTGELRREGELSLFGNLSIELGIDLENLEKGLITASTVGELVQRLGRLGRKGADSEILIPVPKHYYDHIVHDLGGTRDYDDFVDKMSRYMPDHQVVEKVLDRYILESHLGKLRVYLPLATMILAFLAATEKVQDRVVDETLNRFTRIVELLGILASFEWIERKVAKTHHVLAGIAAFRVSWEIPYQRREKSAEKGKASLSTLLANFTLEGYEGEVLILGRPLRKKVAETLVVAAYSEPPLLDIVLPGWLAARLLAITPGGQDSVEAIVIAELLRHSSQPVYVAPSSEIFKLLNAYGYAIRVVKGRETKAFLIPL